MTRVAAAWRPAAWTLAGAALVVAAFALYATGLHYPPVFDDQGLNESWLRSHAASPFTRRWISDLSFQWIYLAFGKAVFPQRVLNVLLHGMVAVVLFGFFARLFGALLDERRARWLAFFGATLFVLHPVGVYAVAYLVERSIILATFFSIASLWLTLEWLLRGAPLRSAWWVAAVAAYYLAGFSKEHAVMLPAAAVALALLVRGPSIDLARRGAVPLALCAAVAVTLALSARHAIGGVYEDLAREAAGELALDSGVTYPLSVLNQATLYFRYLLTWLVPLPALMSIDLRPAFPSSLLDWTYLAGFAAWLALPFAAGWLLLRRGVAGLAGFGLAFSWLLALTEVATVRVQEPLVLYRSYLWMSALPSFLPFLLGGLAPRWRVVLLAALCAMLVVPARDRLATFEGEVALWTDAIAKNKDLRAPYVERAFVQRGTYYLGAGRTDAALADLDRAVELNPRSAAGHFVRGAVHIRRRDLDAALDDANRAIALDPAYAAAYNMRCVLLVRKGDAQAALADCGRALEIDPTRADSWINRAVAYRALGRMADAAASYERALALTPANAQAHAEYGKLLFDAGRRDEMMRAHLAKACQAGIAAACETLRGVP